MGLWLNLRSKQQKPAGNTTVPGAVGLLPQGCRWNLRLLQSQLHRAGETQWRLYSSRGSWAAGGVDDARQSHCLSAPSASLSFSSSVWAIYVLVLVLSPILLCVFYLLLVVPFPSFSTLFGTTEDSLAFHFISTLAISAIPILYIFPIYRSYI